MLAAWDEARTAEGALQRALALLQLSPQNGSDEMAALTIRERDRRLLDLHEELFGKEVAALASCTCCGELLETRFLVETMRASPPVDRSSQTLHVRGESLEFRLPNSNDLAAVLPMSTEEHRRSRLLQLLVVRKGKDGTRSFPDEIPEEIAEEIERRMAELDPQADTELAFVCDACGRSFVTCFDIASFLWAELDGWARRTLREVHVLARAYGWTESETLSIHPSRRSLYLEMLSE